MLAVDSSPTTPPPPLGMALALPPCSSWLPLLEGLLLLLSPAAADCPDLILEPEPLSSFIPPAPPVVVVSGWPVEGCCCCVVPGSDGCWPPKGDSAIVLHVHVHVCKC